MSRIARSGGRSISDVAREAISIGLETLALGHLQEIREAALAKHGVCEGNVVAEARSERDRGPERARRGAE